MRLAPRLLLLAALLVVLVAGETPERTRFWQALFDFGHAPLMGVAALVVRDLLAARGGAWPRRAPVAAFALTVGLGAAVEALRMLQPDRTASLTDLSRDAAGAAAFLLLRDGLRTNRAGLRRLLPSLAGVAVLAAASAGFARTAALYVERDRALPTLFALDGSWWERELMTTLDSRLTPGPRLARLDLAPGTYPGISFDEPYPDWRRYHRLVVEIVSDLDAPFPMAIRIHDAAHNQRYEDRFTRRFIVQPGENRYDIPLAAVRRAPLGREMDLSRIRGFMIFTRRLQRPTHVYLRPLRLE